SLAIAGNAFNSPGAVALVGAGVAPPVAGISPTALEGTAQPGSQIHRTLRICNTGGSALAFGAGFGAVLAPSARNAPAMRGTGPRGHAGGSDGALSLPHQPARTMSGSVTWARVTPDTGTVSPASCMDLDVVLDASSLAAGDYSTHLLVQSSDPAQPVIDVS